MSLKEISRANSLIELAKACKAAAKSLEKGVTDIAKDASSRLVLRLVYETPVDTSQALSNWQVSYEIPTSKRLRAYKIGEGGSTQEYSAQRAYRVAKSIINKKQPRIDLIVSNNVTYIHKLNLGGSKQQSAFFIERIETEVNLWAHRELKDFVNGN